MNFINRKFNIFFGSLYLKLKILFSIVPVHLYPKLFINLICNYLKIYRPSSAAIGLTYRCQLNCCHCSAGDYKIDRQKELSLSEFKILFKNIAATGVPRVNLTGGEALLRDDIFHIIKESSRYFITILESNGQLLTYDNIIKLKNSGVSCVAISIDSFLPGLHDKLRNKEGCFEKAVVGIKNCIDLKLPCIISTYITLDRATDYDIKTIIKMAKSLKVLAVRIMPPRPVGSFSCSNDSLLTKKEKNLIANLIDNKIAYFIGMPAPASCGIFTKATFYVSPYGELQPCPYLPIEFGNIKENNLNSLLNRMWSHDIFNIQDKECVILNKDFREKFFTRISNKKLPLKV